MYNPGLTPQDRVVLARVIAALEQQLIELDRMRLFVGAAHVDAAIEHLRLEQAQQPLH